MPSHGGGKRFAVEQELIAASARTALKAMDFKPLAGRSVRVVFSSIGDEGSGNLTGGRMTVDRLLRGDYSTGVTLGSDLLGNIVRGPGWSFQAVPSTMSDGPTFYRSEAFINPRDVEFLSSLVTRELVFAGAQVKSNPTAAVDILVLVIVDVFGTIRDRTDLLVVNQERLRARTSLEIAAVRQADGAVVMSPKMSAAEAVWEENYLFWIGPGETKRAVYPVNDLLMPPSKAEATADLRPIRADEGVAVRAPPVKEPAVPDQPVGLPNLLPKPDTKPRTNPPYR